MASKYLINVPSVHYFGASVFKVFYTVVYIFYFITIIGCSSSPPPAVVEPQVEIAPQNSADKVSDKKGVGRLPKQK